MYKKGVKKSDLFPKSGAKVLLFFGLTKYASGHEFWLIPISKKINELQANC
jgi:hypothetical protein